MFHFASFMHVYFAHVNFCPFSLPPGVRGWLWLVIVALHGLFLLTFLYDFFFIDLFPDLVLIRRKIPYIKKL